MINRGVGWESNTMGPPQRSTRQKLPRSEDFEFMNWTNDSEDSNDSDGSSDIPPDSYTPRRPTWTSTRDTFLRVPALSISEISEGLKGRFWEQSSNGVFNPSVTSLTPSRIPVLLFPSLPTIVERPCNLDQRTLLLRHTIMLYFRSTPWESRVLQNQ